MNRPTLKNGLLENTKYVVDAEAYMDKLESERNHLREVLTEVIAVTSEEDVAESRIDAAFNIARAALQEATDD